MGGNTSKCEKSKNHCTLLVTSLHNTSCCTINWNPSPFRVFSLMRAILASAVENRSCIYTVLCTTGEMSVTAYSAREPANIDRNNYLPPLPTVLYKVHSPTFWISFRCVPVCTVPAPFLRSYHRWTMRPWNASSKGRIIQGTHRPRDETFGDASSRHRYSH